jgi:hypothetical protein
MSYTLAISGKQASRSIKHKECFAFLLILKLEVMFERTFPR